MTTTQAELQRLSASIEAAGAESNRRYCAGLDTSAVDAELDRLIAEYDRAAAERGRAT